MRSARPVFPLFFVVSDELKGINNEEIIKEIKESKPLSGNIHLTRNEDLGLSKDKSCKHLLKQLDEMFKEMEKGVVLECEELWGQVTTKNMCCGIHTHYNANQPNRNGYSFVYYANAEKNCGNLVFDLEYGQKRYDTDIEPKTGLLIIFPLNIKHFTRRNTTNNERVVVAGNYIITGKRNDSN